MKRILSMLAIPLICVFVLCGCNAKNPSNQGIVPTESTGHFNDHVPYEAMLNLEVMGGKFVFQRIATTPCIVYSNTPITEMSKGTMYEDRHDVLTAIFQATNGKDAIADTSECCFSHYIYMFDNEREGIPWHYRFAICTCGAVMITNNDELICTISLTEDEIQSILSALENSNSGVSTDTNSGSLSNEGYFAPNYQSTNTFHCDEFLEILKRDGYYRDGEMDHNYNTDNITSIVNITPKSISDETSDVDVVYVNTHCFLMINQTIYRYDTFGGYHHQLCLWDYDGNGTKDLVSYHTWGSGLSYLSVSIFDLTSMESINVISRMILSEPSFSFECKNGVIFIDGAELTYSDGSFHCSAFATESKH